MITSEQIINAVNVLMVDAIEAIKQVHINVMPEDFERPALFIENPRYTREDVNFSTVRVTTLLALTYFGAIDEHAISDTAELRAAQDAMMAVFDKRYVLVGDRALKCGATIGSTGFDMTAVDVTFTFNDERYGTAETLPVAAAVTTTIKQEG